MKARKILILMVFVLVAGTFYYLDLGRYLTLESLKSNRARLEDLRDAHTFLFVASFVLVYIVQTAFSLPGAAVLSLASGAIFGVLQGTVYVVTGATVGAVLAFLVSRTLLRDWVVRKFGGRMEGIDRGLRENGLSYLLFLRLVPAFPFFLVNLASGITGLPLRIYVLGTFFGIMPGSLVFVNAGASLGAIESVSQVASLRVLGSFALLGLFALVPTIFKAVKKRRERSRRQRVDNLSSRTVHPGWPAVPVPSDSPRSVRANRLNLPQIADLYLLAIHRFPTGIVRLNSGGEPGGGGHGGGLFLLRAPSPSILKGFWRRVQAPCSSFRRGLRWGGARP